MTTDREPFFRREGDAYQPTEKALGFWGPNPNLHARTVIGLLARAIEREHAEPGLTPARLTVDLYRLPDLSPATVTTRVVRKGGRIAVVDAEFFSSGVSSARAACQLLRRTAQPEGNLWRGPSWDAPSPDALPPGDSAYLRGLWEIRPVPPRAGDRGPARTWLRELRPLVDEEPWTPFTRVATGVDWVSPFANAGDRGLGFINTDVTLYLHRPLEGDWVGYEVTEHQSSDGVAVAHCALHDPAGPIGFAACTALAQRRPPG
jgi:hypothetical protein